MQGLQRLNLDGVRRGCKSPNDLAGVASGRGGGNRWELGVSGLSCHEELGSGPEGPGIQTEIRSGHPPRGAPMRSA